MGDRYRTLGDIGLNSFSPALSNVSVSLPANEVGSLRSIVTRLSEGHRVWATQYGEVGIRTAVYSSPVSPDENPAVATADIGWVPSKACP